MPELSGETSTGTPMLSAKDLAFGYPATKRKALSGVSFAVGRGEVLGVVGPVGAGKTTLCMSLAGFAPRTTGGDSTGELEVAGLDPREAPGGKMAERVGMVFEDYSAQITQVRVLDEVMTPLMNRGVPASEAEDRACGLLHQVGLAGLGIERKRTWELSGGQQQRVAIAATLSVDPEVIILDSATGMLDPEGREEVRAIIADLAGETTLVIAENDADFLVGIADRMLILSDGGVVATGPSDEILRNADVLSRGGVDPPVTLRVAHVLGLRDSPITEEEFGRAVGRVEVSDEEPAADGHGDETGFGRPVVRVEGAAYRYPDGTAALEGVNVEVREGEVHAIVGGNGAGKTTLAKMIVGLKRPSEGSISVGGVDTKGETAADLAWKVGTTFQNPDEQISERTVAEEVAFPLRRRRYERTGLFSRRERYGEDYVEERLSAACDLAGLEEDLLGRDPSLLPGGQRRLVTTAEALALDPSVLVLDEPRVGLDAASRRRLAETISRLQKMGKAVVLIEHDMDLVCMLADTATVLNRGRVALQGPTREVFARRNWDLLSEMYLQPPRAARLARSVGASALTVEDLASQLSRAREVR